MPALFSHDDFHIAPGVAHLCAGGKTPVLRRTADAILRYLADKSDGPAGDARQEEEILGLRQRLAGSWGCGVDEIGLVSSVAEGVSMLAGSLDWREGDEVVVPDIEYPSLAAPFALLPGVTLRVAEGVGGIAAAVTPRTRAIAVSSTSFLEAGRADLPALRALADRAGALLVVDHTQSAGWMPIEAGVADFAFAAGYKWLLGISGLAVAYWNRARQPGWAPRSAGWYSMASQGRPDWRNPVGLVPDAMRFCRGNPNHAGVYALNGALDYLAGHPGVEAHVLGLAGELRRRCLEAQLPMMTPERHGASVCLPHPEAAKAVKTLEEGGVLTWNGRGRIRISFHGYNDEFDMERAFEQLRALF
ncbi:aminotransferase class V-fold PLP-dependent enzyme [Roseococcus sp. SYP-B2431]|uniref:aminotransferase class V-fold PLP-dependent enzyme n=1 Tax=Roseococcus sp. SYP-B2431 TaxID=2496640 RepID=UPI0010409F2E|nr:aminotransferase class V-fold PLP-dependent enzyme [Roseococcus sp. SYP-B2431]TCI00229.1 aminotransferase class V-fold PLP-dependent enzyme [Roseococcus sp. SYP-B2431]